MNSHPPVKLHYTTAYQYYRYTEAKTTPIRNKFLETFKKVLTERLPEGLSVEISDLQFKIDDRLYVELTGQRKSDVKFSMNVIKELTGETHEAHNVPKKQPIMGSLRNVGKVGFGLFADVGIENPQKEVLIPLHVLREQLVKGEKQSTKEIIKQYGFINYFPVEVMITEIEDQHSKKPKYEARFSDKFISKLRDWIDWELDIVFTTGEARQMVKRTLAKRGHTIDVLEIQRLGPLEVAVICNQGTNGPGIISHIGKFLPHCKMSTLSAKRIKKYWT